MAFKTLTGYHDAVFANVCSNVKKHGVVITMLQKELFYTPLIGIVANRKSRVLLLH